MKNISDRFQQMYVWVNRLRRAARGGIWQGLVCSLDVRIPFTPWVFAFQPPTDNQRGFWIDRYDDKDMLIGLGFTVLYVMRGGRGVPLVQLAH